MGLFVSWDAGGSWSEAPLSNLPTVAVHDVLVHPRENDLIVGTHGRAIWIFDDATPLQQWPAARDGEGAHLFPVRPALRFPTRFTRYGLGDKTHRAPNPPYGALLTYFLPESLEPVEGAAEEAAADEDGADEAAAEDAEPRLTLEILGAGGEVLRTLESLPLSAGLHRVAWNLATDGPAQRRPDTGEYSEFRDPPRGPYVLPGTYTARLTVDGEVSEAEVVVEVDPGVGADAAALEAQHDAATTLNGLVSEFNLALRRLDSVAQQLEARKATAELLEVEFSAEAEEQIEKFEEAFADLMARLARGDDKPFWSQGPRLTERLSDLFSSVDGQFAAPTDAQQSLLGELVKEAEEARRLLSDFHRVGLKELNETLSASGLPPIAAPAPAAP